MKRLVNVFLALGLFTAILGTLLPSTPAQAAGPVLNMADNGVFDNTGAMSTSQIQAYLSTKNTTDFSNDQTCLASYTTPNFHWDGNSWHYGDLTSATSYGQPWSSSYGPSQISAAQAIYQTGQFWGLNPQVILATLEKEEALPHGTSCAQWRFNSAMGQNCPNNDLHDYPNIGIYGTCVAQERYAGFTRQVLWGSFQLRFARLRAEGDGNLSWQDNGSVSYVGKETAGCRARYAGGPATCYDGQVNLCNTSGGGCQTWTLANGATASLVSYTPYYPQMFGYWLNQIISFSGGSTTCKGTDQANVYRFWSQRFNNTHFFTTSTAERDALFNDPAWKYEGVAYCGVNAPQTGYVPVYRYWSPKFSNSHFYTTSTAERDALAADGNWRYEGISFYVPADQTINPAAAPIKRYWSPRFNNDHFFTGGSAEQGALSGDANWRYEGVGWYAELPQ